MKYLGAIFALFAFSGLGAAQSLNCNMQDYKSVDGIKVDSSADSVAFTWEGEAGSQLRASFGLRGGQPVVKELSARKGDGEWIPLGKDLTPQFEVTTGKRRIDSVEMANLKKYNLDTPENEEMYKWFVFWDAPLAIPGTQRLAGPPRQESEITRAAVSYKSDSCKVATNGDRVSITFNGLSLGLFSGDLQFTVYKGSNLVRQEALAKTDAQSVAYIYKAGLKGFSIDDNSKVTWRDTSQVWQQEEFGGAINHAPINLRARNRLEILEVGVGSKAPGSLAILPPPHKFFFARENEVNLGYVYYRKDDDKSFSLGVMQPERGEGYAPWGVSDEVWKRRVGVAREQVENYALYNAPPGTVQHMAVYYYLNPDSDHPTQRAVMAYTNNDVYKPIPGFKTITGHFHLELNEMARDRGTTDFSPSWVPVFKGIGINIVYLGDFHDDSDGNDPGPKRLPEQKLYFEASANLSDKNFLVIPAEEANAYIGGHSYIMMPRPVYFTHTQSQRPADQKFEEDIPGYGHVYHLGSATDVLKMVDKEGAILWAAHPRTKSTALFPDLYKDAPFFLSDRFIGASWESLPVDLSQKRLCEIRCFGVNDDMSNWAPTPKFMLAEGDTYMKLPADDSYSSLAINYLKLDKVPSYKDSWSPIVEGLRAGNFFGTTGEILFHNWGIEGSGAHSTYTASIEYTFPLDFAELVWSDGSKVDRQIINLTDTTPFGTKTFRVPFDATGKKWVRFAVWDSAGNGAWLQPVQPK
ncbi:MAG TPA: hypothetical protein VI320_16715 [Terracidiphilus sp.]|jgi:hypothetical protein